MSEFQQNPEGLRSEQIALENNLFGLNQQFSAMKDGNKAENRTQEESDRIIALATYTKRQLFGNLVGQGDIEEISNRLAAEIYSQKQGLAEEDDAEGFPLYVEVVFEDTFGLGSDDDKVHEDIRKVLHNLAKEYGIDSFEDED